MADDPSATTAPAPPEDASATPLEELAPRPKKQRRGRIPWLRNLLGLLAAAAFVAGPVLAWRRELPALAGFGLFAAGGLLSLLLVVAGVVSLLRGRRFGIGAQLATLVGLVFVGLAAPARDLPRINDFTTDLADPPAFRHAGSVPANAGRDLGYPADFGTEQRKCCSDLGPVEVAADADVAFAHVRRAAERMPDWSITAVDAEGRTIEAVATTLIFGFQDDVVIRVRPAGEGRSRVDMRSKSRDGRGDVGANAARIRAFLRAVEVRGEVG